MDLAIVPAREVMPAQMVIPIRSPGGGGFSVYRVSLGGGEASSWRPHSDNEWTEYDTPTQGDPASLTLSLSPDRLCRVEVKSMRRHTVYRQVEKQVGLCH